MSTTTAVLGKFLKKQTAVILPQVCHLHLQEYQSKELLRTNGCIVQKFFLVDRKNNEHHLLDELFNRHAYFEYVVKSQILAGGRGKGRFIGDEKGGKGVFITRSPQEAKDSVRNMIGKRLVTTQTSPKGVSVNQVMVAESVPIKRETYLSILMDSTTNGPLVVACPSGGVDIEEIAKKSPELILKEPIPIDAGISAKQCFKIAAFLEFEGKLAEKAAKQIQRLYELFVKVDSTQIEINPFAETADGHVFCIDAKLNFDDNAAFRQQQIFDMDTFEEMDVREINARKCGLNYIGLDGNIACMVNGAGLAMATMDIIKLHGGSPANFLDVGGGANKEQVYEAFKIITSDAGQVRVIFVNIFGGILRCDIIAEGVVRACSELKIDIPVVLRLKGTRVNEAKSLLSNATHNQNIGGTFELLESFEEAANRAVELARRPNDNGVGRMNNNNSGDNFLHFV